MGRPIQPSPYKEVIIRSEGKITLTLTDPKTGISCTRSRKDNRPYIESELRSNAKAQLQGILFRRQKNKLLHAEIPKFFRKAPESISVSSFSKCCEGNTLIFCQGLLYCPICGIFSITTRIGGFKQYFTIQEVKKLISPRDYLRLLVEVDIAQKEQSEHIFTGRQK